MKKFTFYAFSSILLFACNTGNDRVGGPCHYEKFQENMTGLGWDNEDSLIFRFENDVTQRKYGIGLRELEELHFPKMELIKGKEYAITVEQITEGSCVPFTILKIEKL